MRYLFILSLLLSCRPSSIDLGNKVNYSRIHSDNKFYIGAVEDSYSSILEYKPHTGSYHCFYDNSAGLIISFGWGSGTSGESIRIKSKNGLFDLSADAGGCGMFDSFDYLTMHQKLILSDTALVNIDTIIGYIEYRGIQDTEGMKQIFKKYESDLINNYGLDLTYFDTLQPRTLSVIGTFRIPKCNHTDSSKEFHKFIKLSSMETKRSL